MSDDRRWDETRRIDPDDADQTRRVEHDPSAAGRTQRLDPADGEHEQATRRLDPADGGHEQATQRIDPADPGARSEPLDAVGDSTYDDPYGDSYPASDRTEYPAAEEARPLEAEPGRRDGWRTALVLLLGIGLGFVAGLVVVALFGSDVADDSAIAARDQRIAELEEQVAEAEAEAEALEATVEQRDEQIADLQAGLDDAEGDLSQRQQALDDREQSLDQREQALDDREAALDQREQALDEAEEPGGDPPGNGLPDDIDLPDIDPDEAEAWIDRIIEGIRDLFR